MEPINGCQILRSKLVAFAVSPVLLFLLDFFYLFMAFLVNVCRGKGKVERDEGI